MSHFPHTRSYSGDGRRGDAPTLQKKKGITRAAEKSLAVYQYNEAVKEAKNPIQEPDGLDSTSACMVFKYFEDHPSAGRVHTRGSLVKNI
ncbi:hypothetical protein SUGI_0495480 [Cryptomeria japonica]|nr:hypothetical protein SUGI_0495480 [Cryptomeria japonica]